MEPSHHPPNRVELQPDKATVILTYGADTYELSAEYLRVYSPSAEVTGHGRGNEVLQTGKRHVRIHGIEPVGNYGLKFIFSDGHDSGIYDWNYLKTLATNMESNWQDYLSRLEKANASRD